MLSIKEAPLFALLLLILVFPSRQAVPRLQQATPTPSVQLFAPLPGEALQGVVTIEGNTAVDGFRSADLLFGYQSDPTNTWFLLAQSTRPVSEGSLGQWDTTTISDGFYRLRVQVFLVDGQVLDSQVEGLRVRNYSPIETSTPAVETAAVAQVLPTATATPLPDFQPPERTPRVLPTNPAELTPLDLRGSLIGGVGVVAAALVGTGIYLGLKALFRR